MTAVSILVFAILVTAVAGTFDKPTEHTGSAGVSAALDKTTEHT